MEVIGFQVAYPTTHRHQIEYRNDSEFDGSEYILEKVITRIQDLFRKNSTVKAKEIAISEFLEYHFQESSNKNELLSQLIKITEDPNWTYIFKPDSESIGFIQDWIKEKKLPIEKKVLTNRKTHKLKESFQDLIIDNNKFLLIEKKLLDFKYINSDSTWTMTNVKLAAWYKILVKHKVIKQDASAGKLFSERYKLKMNLKPFQESYEIKPYILDPIEKDCGLS